MNTTQLTDLLHQRADQKLSDWLNRQIDPVTDEILKTPYGANYKTYEGDRSNTFKECTFLLLREEWRRREVAEFMAKVEATNATETP